MEQACQKQILLEDAQRIMLHLRVRVGIQTRNRKKVNLRGRGSVGRSVGRVRCSENQLLKYARLVEEAS